MRRSALLVAAAAMVALPLALAPGEASASCQGRKNTGMVLGGLGGALVGNSVSRGGGGAVIGGLGGAVLGHEIAKSGCAPRRTAYRARGAPRSAPRAYAERTPVRRVYYDQYGAPVPVQPINR